MATKTKQSRRKKIHLRIRKQIKGTATRPRLSVFRSNKSIYCQLIDDTSGVTLTSATSTDDGVPKDGNRIEQAKQVGSILAGKAKELNIDTVVFDRGGYLYHGRVKALAEGARENGLKL
jgi:large subunit ribosomal protein L18